MIEPNEYSLEPVTVALTQPQLLHLLRRCLFGVSPSEAAGLSGKTASECLQQLLTPEPETDLVQQDTDVPDPLVPRGKPWYNAPYETDLINNRRQVHLKMWWVGQILERRLSLTEKMRLFWHNHFVTQMDVVKDSRYNYRYVTMLRRHALGNFKQLIREGTTNVAMLVYLNGNTNRKAAPNENYARELLELFTLGKENNPNYTEEDVKATARVLTGWVDNHETIREEFIAEQHDAGDKQFSAFFQHHIIKGRSGADGALEVNDLIDLIFSKPETARFVCRNLYRWLVSAHITARTEKEIIEPLAQVFIQNNFEIAPVLRTLLCSRHFYDPFFYGGIVKSPVDFLPGAAQQFGTTVTNVVSTDTRFETYLQYYFYLGDLTQDIGSPPSVAGWPAYYQPPRYHQWWINSASLSLKAKIINGLASRTGLLFNGPMVRLNFTGFAAQLTNAGSAPALVAESAALLLPVPVSPHTITQLQQTLLGNQLTETAWAELWNKYASAPNDAAAGQQVEEALSRLYGKIISLPEYQLM